VLGSACGKAPISASERIRLRASAGRLYEPAHSKYDMQGNPKGEP